jgi:hypothetical protein
VTRNVLQLKSGPEVQSCVQFDMKLHHAYYIIHDAFSVHLYSDSHLTFRTLQVIDGCSGLPWIFVPANPERIAATCASAWSAAERLIVPFTT